VTHERLNRFDRPVAIRHAKTGNLTAY
jgi:hypothetical protein